MPSFSALSKIDFLVLFVGGVVMVIGSLLLLEIALHDLGGIYQP